MNAVATPAPDTPSSPPQAGQTKPSGQRLAARCRAQEASSGKPASKAARDMGRSYFQRLAMTEHYTNMLPIFLR